MKERIFNDFETIFGDLLQDLQIYIDEVSATEIRVSMFWNRISLNYWGRAKVFQFESSNYNRFLENEVKSFANELS